MRKTKYLLKAKPEGQAASCIMVGLVAPLSISLLRATLSQAHTAPLCNRLCAESSLPNGELSTSWNHHFSHSDIKDLPKRQRPSTVAGFHSAGEAAHRPTPAVQRRDSLAGQHVYAHTHAEQPRKSQLQFFNFILIYFFKVVCVWVFYLHVCDVCVPQVCLVPSEIKTEHRIAWNRS